MELVLVRAAQLLIEDLDLRLERYVPSQEKDVNGNRMDDLIPSERLTEVRRGQR